MENIMQYQPVLPKDFDGTFRFTNWTEEDFVARWNSKEYRFPAKPTSPIIINDQTPLEIQSIRKKFAKDLAEREFSRSVEFEKLRLQERNNDGTPRLNSIHQAGAYSIESLTPYIQRCLEPLPVGRVEVSVAETVPLEDKLSRADDGSLNTEAIDKKISLRKKALES
jgi:hypothetical protein